MFQTERIYTATVDPFSYSWLLQWPCGNTSLSVYSFIFFAQGRNDIEYFQIALHKTMTEKKNNRTIKNKPRLQCFKIACSNSQPQLLIYIMCLYGALWPVNTGLWGWSTEESISLHLNRHGCLQWCAQAVRGWTELLCMACCPTTNQTEWKACCHRDGTDVI